MQCHPDRNPATTNAEHRFKEINEAYEVLKDPDKRAAYDRFGHAAFEQGGGRGPGFGADFATTFSDIFDDLFGMGGRRGRGSGRERGADLRYNMEITLQEALLGKTAQIRIPTSVTCEACSGSGAKAGTKPKACRCAAARPGPPRAGLLHAGAHLPELPGPRPVIDSPCASCAGSGRVTRERTLSVNIPRASRTAPASGLPARAKPACAAAAGRSLHFPVDRRASVLSARRRRSALPRAGLDGDGGAGRRVRGADHRRRQDQGENPRGHPVRPALPPAGKGMPVLRSRQTGDMYVQVVVETPQNLTKKQRELLAEFDRLSSGETQPESSGFFGKVKEFLDGFGGRATSD
jgi:molecular chaperone DnaJ